MILNINVKAWVYLAYVTIQKVVVNMMINFSIKFPLKYVKTKFKFTPAIYGDAQPPFKFFIAHVHNSCITTHINKSNMQTKCRFF